MRRLFLWAAAALLLTGCGAQTPALLHPLPPHCWTPPPGTMAVLAIRPPGSITCNGGPALGCATAQALIEVEPPRSRWDIRWAELVLHELCHVTDGAWHP